MGPFGDVLCVFYSISFRNSGMYNMILTATTTLAPVARKVVSAIQRIKFIG